MFAIKVALDNAGISQSRLAVLMNVTPATVSKWTRGTAKPRHHRLAQLEALLGVPEAQLFQEVGISDAER